MIKELRDALESAVELCIFGLSCQTSDGVSNIVVLSCHVDPVKMPQRYQITKAA